VLGNGQTVTVAFGGDANFDGSNAARVASDPSSILAGVARCCLVPTSPW
jgi:hypothetical protein